MAVHAPLDEVETAMMLVLQKEYGNGGGRGAMGRRSRFSVAATVCRLPTGFPVRLLRDGSGDYRGGSPEDGGRRVAGAGTEGRCFGTSRVAWMHEVAADPTMPTLLLSTTYDEWLIIYRGPCKGRRLQVAK